MKKSIALFLVLCLMLALAGCGASASSSVPAPASSQAQASIPASSSESTVESGSEPVSEPVSEAAPEPPPFEPFVIADDELVTMTALQMIENDRGPGFDIEITNNSDKVIYVKSVWNDGFTIDGVAVAAYMGATFEPGETFTTGLAFENADYSYLEGGLGVLVNIVGTIVVEVDETSEELARYEFMY